jgi:hypothetical protein
MEFRVSTILLINNTTYSTPSDSILLIPSMMHLDTEICLDISIYYQKVSKIELKRVERNITLPGTPTVGAPSVRTSCQLLV